MMAERQTYAYRAPFSMRGDVSDWEDGEEIEVTVREDGRIVISVTEDHAMDSYNQSFTCSIILPVEEVAKLKAVLPASPKE
jgi:hypothetical protein